MSRNLTTEEFIYRARLKHGDKYDYSKVEYKNTNFKVCIICHEKDENGIEHGEFWQTPKMHLKGYGCPNCRGKRISLSKTHSTKDFIEKSVMKHGNRYDYSKVDYKGLTTEVCIICPIHGEFLQTPANHLYGNHGKGSECPKCANRTRGEHRASSLQDFIVRAKEVHGEKYDYSKFEYNGCEEKSCIICPIHGEFWQTPISHLQGCGCTKCGYEKIGNNMAYTTEDFICLASDVHGNFYDYSKSDYKDSQTTICIICPEHGEFWQRPATHLSGCGCPKCAGHERLDIELFIKKATKVHGKKYDYSEVVYVNNHTKVCVICPIHGRFWQKPNSHLNGCGCPHCKESHGEKSVRIWLDKNAINYEREYRIAPTQVLFGRNLFKIDFYLPDHNTFIEFHGAQHYERQSNWQTEEEFADQQDRDRRLREYCKSKGIKLIEIPYTEIDNIDRILSKKIKVLT